MAPSLEDDFGVWRVRVLSSEDEAQGRGVHALSRTLEVSMDAARALLATAPFDLPLNLERPDAIELALDLRESGLETDARSMHHASSTRCATHRNLANTGQCKSCHAWICVVCKAQANGSELCQECFQKHGFWTLIRHGRIALLLVLLVAVASWGWSTRDRLESRKDWSRTLRVGVVVLEMDPIDPQVVGMFESRLNDLESLFSDEFQRLTGERLSPFEFRVVGSVRIDSRPPPMPEPDAGIVDNLKTTRALDRFLEEPADELKLNPRHFDSVIWVVASDPGESAERRFVEGLAEFGGDRGLVRVELDPSMDVLAAAAVGHELLHTLGATDKYGAQGPVTGDGFYESSREPLYPQERAEIMAREIPTGPGVARLPDFIAELGVGRRTAIEIGWINP